AYDPGVRRRGEALRPANAAGSNSEVPLYRYGPCPAVEQAGHTGVAEDKGPREEGNGGHERRAAEVIRSAEGSRGYRVLHGHEHAARIRGCVRLQRDGGPAYLDCGYQARY